MDPRIAQIVAREMPNAIVVVPEPAKVSSHVTTEPMLESARLLRQKYGPAAMTPSVAPDPIQMVVVEYPGGRHETLVIDLSNETVIATSG